MTSGWIGVGFFYTGGNVGVPYDFQICKHSLIFEGRLACTSGFTNNFPSGLAYRRLVPARESKMA
jgi:hypothetical protein